MYIWGGILSPIMLLNCIPDGKSCKMERTTDFVVRTPGFKAQLSHLLPVGPWVSHLTCTGLCVLIYKGKGLVLASSEVSSNDQWTMYPGPKDSLGFWLLSATVTLDKVLNLSTEWECDGLLDFLSTTYCFQAGKKRYGDKELKLGSVLVLKCGHVTTHISLAL